VAAREDVITALQSIEDPELYLDIWFLGLIYSIDIEGSTVKIEMTFTSPACPAGPELVWRVRDAVGALSGVEEVLVNVVFSPPWEPPEQVKAALGFL
jgi:metal-sulfur cluster biosynthetic enzyme